MNILIITTHLEPGGIAQYVVSLAKGLAKKGNRVFVASSGGAFVKLLDEAGVAHVTFNVRTKSELSPKLLTSFFKLRTFIRKNNIQILHAQTRVTQVLSWFLSRSTGVAYVSTCHGFFRPRFFRRRFGAWGERVIAVSEPVAQHLEHDMRIPKAQICLIHNGIDCSRCRITDKGVVADFKNHYGIKDGVVVGIIARLSEVKGHRYLIEAFAKVIKVYPGVQLVIVGDGKIKPELVSLAQQFDVASSVIFIPSVADIALALSVIDIFVMPSLQEGLGLAIMQAQAAGLAVVASDVGGIPTLIKNNETGLLVGPRDAAVLAEAIGRLIHDKELRHRLGVNARKVIEANFSVDEMVSSTEKVYREGIQS